MPCIDCLQRRPALPSPQDGTEVKKRSIHLRDDSGRSIEVGRWRRDFPANTHHSSCTPLTLAAACAAAAAAVAAAADHVG
jgi:hypothetical protein